MSKFMLMTAVALGSLVTLGADANTAQARSVGRGGHAVHRTWGHAYHHYHCYGHGTHSYGRWNHWRGYRSCHYRTGYRTSCYRTGSCYSSGHQYCFGYRSGSCYRTTGCYTGCFHRSRTCYRPSDCYRTYCRPACSYRTVYRTGGHHWYGSSCRTSSRSVWGLHTVARR
jgi:hypothetical protein